MIYKTHHVAALCAGELVLIYFHQPVLTWQTPVALIAAYFFGPVADVDQPQSYVGQKILPVSLFLEGVGIRHRTFTHSIIWLILLWFLLLMVPIPSVIRWAILAGYASHPIVDLFNEQGVEILWPIRFRIKLLPGFLAIPVESPAEMLIRGALQIFGLFLLLMYLYPTLKGFPIVGTFLTYLVHLFPGFVQTYFL